MGLLEREACLDKLARVLQDAASGEGRVALVSGEAGIGKTALVAWFTFERRSAVRVLWGACDALFTPRPLRPATRYGHADAGQLAGRIGVPKPLFPHAPPPLRPSPALGDRGPRAPEALLGARRRGCSKPPCSRPSGLKL